MERPTERPDVKAMQERLDEVEEEIKEVEHDVTPARGPRFVDVGAESEGETDDAIAPPG